MTKRENEWNTNEWKIEIKNEKRNVEIFALLHSIIVTIITSFVKSGENDVPVGGYMFSYRPYNNLYLTWVVKETLAMAEILPDFIF